MAFRYGPGGPINALVGTQVIYQTLINALFFNQPLGSFQYYGISSGVVATVVICAGDEMLEYMGCTKSKQSNSNESEKEALLSINDGEKPTTNVETTEK